MQTLARLLSLMPPRLVNSVISFMKNMCAAQRYTIYTRYIHRYLYACTKAWYSRYTHASVCSKAISNMSIFYYIVEKDTHRKVYTSWMCVYIIYMRVYTNSQYIYLPHALILLSCVCMCIRIWCIQSKMFASMI